MNKVYINCIVVGVVLLLGVNQLTLMQISKNQITFKNQVNGLMLIQEMVVNQQSKIIQKYGSVEYIMESQREYKQLKEESKDDPNKRAIISIIESVYPGITNQFELRRSNSTESGKSSSQG